ncbi:hypothetical protein THZG08_130007 [Vibrio owensii]|nr:hypothetical protein THZG08_130007 [Vibrio owensii]CAH1551075.1 hypothetical protein THOA03_130007 [Vibrio owensii]
MKKRVNVTVRPFLIFSVLKTPIWALFHCYIYSINVIFVSNVEHSYKRFTLLFQHGFL